LNPMTSHLKRWLTGILAVPILFSLIFYGSGSLFLLLVLLLTLAAVMEYNAMVFEGRFTWEKGVTIAAGIGLPLAAYQGGLQLLLSLTTLFFISAFLVFLGRLKDGVYDMAPVNKISFGILYIPLLMSHLVLLRALDKGVFWIFFMIIIAFFGDIAAFYVGRTFGKRKLMAHVSAGKTVEGTIGSVAGSIAGCLAFNLLFFPEVQIIHALIMGVLGNMLGELGDLCESVIKRSAGVKDSGFLFPGHGGVLDRLDCVLFIAPFLYYYRIYVIG